MKHLFNVIDSPLGLISTGVDERGAVAWVAFGDVRVRRNLPGVPAKAEMAEDAAATGEVDRQLREYFEGSRRAFDLDVAPKGSEFQRAAWEMLRKIPYGETRTYGQQAALLGRPNSARAVGRANATNPIAIIIPCHRVIGASGALTGYASGLPIKEALLSLERAVN